MSRCRRQDGSGTKLFTLNSSVEQLSKSLIWVTAAMLQLSKFYMNFGNSDRKSSSLITLHFYPLFAFIIDRRHTLRCHSERSEESPTVSECFYKHGNRIVLQRIIIPTKRSARRNENRRKATPYHTFSVENISHWAKPNISHRRSRYFTLSSIAAQYFIAICFVSPSIQNI